MRNYILVGALAFLVFAVAMVPANVVRLVADRVDGLELRTLSGTLWDGRAQVAYRGAAIGEFAWTFLPGGLLDGEARARWQLTDTGLDVSGIAARGFDRDRVTVTGRLGAATVNRILGRYHIWIAGDFETEELTVVSGTAPPAGGTDVSGVITWPGGRTIYRLSGQSYDTVLPAMVAEVGTVDGEHRLDAKLANGSDAPLLHARLDETGWIAIGLTRGFTTLAGKPWPVPGDDSAVVLTVEQQLFP